MPFSITHIASADKLADRLSWPILEQFYPRERLESLSVTALVALVRSTVTLRAVSAAPVNTSALPQRDRTGPKDWIIVLPAVVFVCIEFLPPQLIGGIVPVWILMLPPLFLLGSIMAALAVKQQRGKQTFGEQTSCERA